MQKICLLLSLFGCAIKSVYATTDFTVEDHVLVLTDDNFDDVMAMPQHEFLMVEFYAPWCGHCKSLAPEYSAAAEVLGKKTPALFVAKVDATVEKKLAERFSIQGFPKLVFFKKGEQIEYNAQRTSADIVNWIVKKTGPSSSEVNCATLKDMITEQKFVISYFGEEETDLYRKAHIPFADAEESIVFVHNKDADCAKEYGATQPSIVFHRKFEEPTHIYSGAAEMEGVKAFANALKVATVFEFTDDDIASIFDDKKAAVILFRNSLKDKDSAFQKVFEEAAITHKGKMLFTYSDSTGGIQERLAEFMGIKTEDLPILTILNPEDGMKKFRSNTNPTDLTVELIGKFIDDVRSGAHKTHLKSQPAPEPNTDPVTIIVGENFDKIVQDPSKDVLVKYYAPWCGHCKSLAPIWEELGEAFKDEKDIVIAKFDATENEHPAVEVTGFPTLIFYPKDNKAGVSDVGGRTLDELKKYIEERSVVLKQKKDGNHDEL